MRLSHRFKVASKKKGGMTAFRRRTRWSKKFRLCTNMPALNFVFNLSGQQFEKTNLKVSESLHELHKALFSTPTLQALFEKQIKMIVENPETMKETLELIANRSDIPVTSTASSSEVGVCHGGHSSPEICGFDLYPLLHGEVVLNTSEQEFLSLQPVMKDQIVVMARRPDTPFPPVAPSPPKHERYISMGCVKDILNISEPAKKTVTQKLAGFITSLPARIRGVFNA